MELRSFFERAIRASFHDLAIRDDPAAPYLADLCTRFARTEHLYPRGVTLPRLETVVDMLLEIDHAWDPAGGHFEPEHELAVRRHIGDYTLFMTGLFRERVERTAGTRYYVTQGKRAYQFVSEHQRATAATTAGRPPFRRLAERFEHYASALDYARRAHFPDSPHHPFFRLRFE